MKVNHDKVRALTESFINGNISYVKAQTKKINKAEFYFLVSGISDFKVNDDPEHIVYLLTSY